MVNTIKHSKFTIILTYFRCVCTGTEEDLMGAIDNATMNMFDNVPVLMKIAWALAKINFDAERVQKMYERVLKIDPQNVMAHELLAKQYEKQDQSELAMWHYKMARDLTRHSKVKIRNS